VLLGNAPQAQAFLKRPSHATEHRWSILYSLAGGMSPTLPALGVLRVFRREPR
jgi:hypothetical protein